MGKKKKYGLLIGAVVIATTIALYALIVDNMFKVPMAYISLAVLVLSEIIATLAFVCFADTRKSIFTSVVFSAHALLLLVLSIIYTNVFPLAYVGFTVVYIISLVVCVLFTLFLCALIAPTEKVNREFKAAKISMLELRTSVLALKSTENGRNYRKELEALEENLRFTDDSVTDAMDEIIKNQINELSVRINDSEYDVKKSIDAINCTIEQRNFVVKNKKSYR